MSTATDVDVATNEWVKKIHFENRVDINLQLPAADGESAKIEIPELPSFDNKLGSIDLPGTATQQQHQRAPPSSNNNTTPTSDSYLSAIVSSSSSAAAAAKPAASSPSAAPAGCSGGADCTCYKCQRQKRRARGTANNKTAPETTPITKAKATVTPPPPPPPFQPLSSSPQSTTITNIVSRNVQPLSKKPSTTSFASSQPATTTRVAAAPKSVNHNQQRQSPSKPSNSKRAQGSICRRKTPSIKSYEKHLPRPTYSAQDSIYRMIDPTASPAPAVHGNVKKSDSQHSSVQSDHSSVTTMNTTTTMTTSTVVHQQDGYQISWKDDTTGDDLLNSLKTFQTIFAEQPGESAAGLSDLLEVRAQEMKRQRAEQAAHSGNSNLALSEEEEMEPPAGQVHTLKYRRGPPHYALTLYHTMKMRGPGERKVAYDTAFDHCIRANSGLSGWIKRQSEREPPKPLQDYTPRQPRRPVKKSILRPIIPGLKHKTTTTDDMWHKISSSENPAPALPPSNPWNKQDDENTTGITPTDVLSAAHALLPNQSPVVLHDSLSRTNVAAKPYDHVDTPSRPIPNHHHHHRAGSERGDAASVSSMSVDGDSSTSKASRSGKLFSSFAKKSLRSRSGTVTSAKSQTESIKKPSSSSSPVADSIGSKEPMLRHHQHQKELDSLCSIMPHVERQVLAQHLADAGGDYIKALGSCKQAVAEGRL
ncbi:hypothetical protein BDB00DRAFT_851777 [Zychaea mexicana]|uniref:uncharacterized protein n=1 Tax=Zychaea mexicana TaxID=64656 RepID=UPI0022FEC2AE|nr:uncharacterized protein BDB00DRAFT_851777 [Zychaea mexicana]KAI9485004.1 hypothetical protein BDB00DRAFT_851777 [Zychaea mexicana]